MGAGVLEVGRKPKAKPGDTPPEAPDQYNIRIGDTKLAERIRDTCRALGLDGANFLRMMIRECLPIYERRADAIARGELPGN